MIIAIESLINNDLCIENKEGVAKYISFKEKEELWEYFRKHISSPVKATVYFKYIPKELREYFSLQGRFYRSYIKLIFFGSWRK